MTDYKYTASPLKPEPTINEQMEALVTAAMQRTRDDAFDAAITIVTDITERGGTAADIVSTLRELQRRPIHHY